MEETDILFISLFSDRDFYTVCQMMVPQQVFVEWTNNLHHMSEYIFIFLPVLSNNYFSFVNQ